jgi:hypothetical protein
MDGSGAAVKALHGFALLVAIPVDRDEFDMAIRGEIYRDYGYILRSAGDGDSIWTQSYAGLSSALSSLISTAEALGVTTCARASLQSLATATAQAHTVILIAHFRGWPVTTADFAGHDEAVLERFKGGDPLLAVKPPSIRSIIDVVGALNDAMQSDTLERFLPEQAQEAAASSPLLRLTLQRDVVDESLAGLIAPGNLIELADGLHAPGTVEGALAPSFHGELDLTMCNSEVLATLIDMRRHGTIRHAYFSEEILPIVHILTIRNALMGVAERGGSYLDELLRLHQSLKNIITTGAAG